MAKAMEIEKIYQKKSQLEHILLRPDTYIGSVEMLKEEMWIWDAENEKMIKKEISFVPGLYKIFDEILVNAADNKQRDPNMSTIRVNIDKHTNTIRIFNNGKGIPVVEHKEEKVLVPTLIFGHLLTSSNYNDDEKKVTGGRNGYGAKLCNIFSKKFVLETSTREYKKSFKQVWHNNMSKADDPILKDAKEDDFTCVTFEPDLAKFKMESLDDDTVALLARRAYDIAASTPGVKVFLNDKRLPITKFEDYCKLYLTNSETDEFNNPLPVKLVYEKVSDRWEVAVACSEMGFQQVSFVNSIATTKGGRHVDYIVDQIVKHMVEAINKKNKKGAQVKPFQIKSHMWIFINCLIENPTFDSQTKENMTLQQKSFGSKCALNEDFFKKLTRAGLLDRVLTWLAFKEKTDLEKAGSKSKQTKIKGIPKLDDANDAGTKESMNCTLIVTEGDSAKTLAVAGLGVIGRDKYGVFPLRGKMLNVREATTKQILENNEISSLLKIIGLNFKEKYEQRESLKQLRYGKLMIMTDQDHDGSHIKGLLINFIHNQWPNLLKHGFVEEFITPIVKVSKGSHQEKSFYSMPEFEEWQQNTENWNTWKIKYYKGLGTSTSKEAKEYFSDMARHRIKFEYSSQRDDLAIQLAFSKRFVDERKDWLTRFMEERKVRREQQTAEVYLYQKDTKQVTYRDFINKELVLFSNLDNERSIPCVVDGFKPGQRKVMFTCFKRNLVKELKVAQLAGSVAELSAYHHGEQSLMSTIINLAQNYVGSNNINLLQPIGQFGTRLHGGKDAASPRYIFTALSPLARLLFNAKDDPLYNYINDDGLKVEPDWYCPILPTVLINGSEGIGTGWSTKIPNYNPRDLIENIRLMINGQEPRPLKPFYKNFRGRIDQLDDIRVLTNGEVAVIGENTVEITELPIGVWTQAFKESVLEILLHGEEKTPTPLINDYKEYHTDTTVRFVVKFTPEQFRDAERTGFHKFFKLQKTLSLNSMVLFDHQGCLKRYNSVSDILHEFFTVRLQMYKKRKEYLEGMMGAESLKLDNIARFIMEKIEGKIKVENMKKADICKMLREKNYHPDPVQRWKEKISRERGYDNTDQSEAAGGETEGGEQNNETASNKDYDYLLGMPIWNLTMEKKDEILKQQRAKATELNNLKAKSVNTLWLDDLDEFVKELDKFETKEREEESAMQLKSFKAGSKEQGRKVNSNNKKMEYMPAPDGIKVEATIDPALASKTEKEAKSKEKQLIKLEERDANIVDIIMGNKCMSESEISDFMSKMGKPAAKRAAASGDKEPKSKSTSAGKSTKVKSEKIEHDENSNSVDDSEEPTTSAKASSKPKKAATSGASKASAKAKVNGNKIESYFKKKTPAAGSESEDDNITDISNCSITVDSSSAAEPRSRRNRKEVKYDAFMVASDDDETTKSSSKTSSSQSSEAKPKAKKTSAKRVVDSESEYSLHGGEEEDDEVLALSDNDDDDDDFGYSKKTKKEPVAAVAAKKTVQIKEPAVVTKPPVVEKKPPVKDAFAEMKAAAAAKKKPVITLNDDDENDENKPPAKKKNKTATSTATTAAAAKKTTVKRTGSTSDKKPAKKKANHSDDDDNDSFLVSDSDYEETTVKKKKKKLMSADMNMFTGAATAAASKKKVARIIDDDDDDFYTIDD